MKRFYLLLFNVFMLAASFAQQVDTSFPTRFTNSTTADYGLYQPDGKYILYGEFVSVNGLNIRGIARFNADGTVDNTFQCGAGVTGSIMSMAMQSDGKYLVAGTVGTYNGQTVKNIFRLNTDGTIDNTFLQQVEFSPYNQKVGIYIQPDGKFFLTGPIIKINGVSVNESVIKLNADGTRDQTFDAETVSSIYSIAVQADGKLIIGGSFSSIGSTTANNIARLNTNGILDTSFNTGTGFNSIVWSVKISGTRIIAGGWFQTFNGATMNYLAALTSTGALDTTYPSNNAPDGALYGMEVQSDGKLVIVGSFTSIGANASNRIARLTTAGAFDTAFKTNIGTAANSYMEYVTINSADEILTLGSSTTFNGQARNGIALLSNNGVLKSMTTSLVLEATASVNDMAAVGNQIVVAHNGKIANGQASVGLELVNEDGSLDATFRSGLTIDNAVRGVFVDNSGNILIGGFFTNVKGSTVGRIARISTSGVIDNTFRTNNGTGFAGGVVYAFAQQADGKLLVGGSFTSFNGTNRRAIVRLNTNGTLDNTFNAANGFAAGQVLRIKIQTDGKVLLGGEFTAFAGNTKNNLIRLNTDGTLDNTFAIGTGLERPGASAGVYGLETGAGETVLVGGSFDRLNGVSLQSTPDETYFIKLNPDGTRVSNHTNQGLFIPDRFTKQADGKILSGDRTLGLTRLNTDGTRDAMFLAIPTGIIYGIATVNGNIYVGGQLGLASNFPVQGFFKVAIPAIPSQAPTLDGSATSATATALTWNDNSTTESGFEIERSLSATSGFAVVATKTANVVAHNDNGLLAHTTYYYRIRTFNPSGYSPYSNVKEITTLQSLPAVPTAPATISTVSSSVLRLTWTDASSNENNFIVKRSLTNTVNSFTTVATLAANTTTYDDSGLTPGSIYYYQIVSSNELGESSTSLNLSGRAGSFNMTNGTITACGGYLFDSGGEFSSYTINSDITTTLLPETAGSSIELNFESFNTNAGFDVLSVYDGTSASAPLIGSYSGTSQVISKIRASTVSGALTLRFQSSTFTPMAGYRIKLGCVVIPVKPTNVNLSVVNTQQVNLTWTDNSTNETGFDVERSTDGTNFTRIGVAAANSTSLSDNATVADQTYYYRVRAKGAVDNSDFTTPVAIAYGVGGVWKLKADFSGPGRTDAVAFTIGQKGYIGTGSAGAYTADVRAFDPAVNSWTTMSGFGGSIRGEAISFVIGTRAFVGTGYKFDREKDLWEYNDQTNTWTQRTDFSGTARTGAVAFVANGKAYVGTGRDASSNNNDFYVYDPVANTWSAIASFPGEVRDGAVAFSINDIGYVGTGRSTSLKKDFWKYDPATNTWTAVADFPSAREEAVAFVVNGKAYVGTGDTGNYQRDFYRYDPVANTWLKVVSFGGTARLAATAFSIDTKGYVATGYDATANRKDVWEFSEAEIPAAPLAPSALSLKVLSATSIQLNWTDNTTNETGFVVERSLTTEDNYTSIASLAANTVTYTDNSLVANTKYYYRVKAVTSLGESGYSPSSNATTLPVPPSTPLNVSATTISSSRIQLNWSASTGVSPVSYVIERATSTDGPFAAITVSYAFSSTDSKYVLTDFNLNSNTTYFYRVASKNTGGLSAYSDVVSAKTLVASVAAPGNLVITSVSATSVRLTWMDNSTNEDSFELERAVGDGAFSLWRSLSSNTTSSDEAGLTEGEKYSFRIKAKLGIDYSDYSGTVSVIIAPNAPTNLTGLLSDDLKTITLQWTDNSSKELGFVIERSISDVAFAPVDTVTTTSYQDVNLTADKKMSYRVYAYIKEKASSTSNVVTLVTTGVEEVNENLLMKAYPNPVRESVTVELNTVYTGTISLDWYDVQGKKLKANKIEKYSPVERYTFQANEIGAGLLLLKITIGNEVITKKLLFQ